MGSGEGWQYDCQQISQEMGTFFATSALRRAVGGIFAAFPAAYLATLVGVVAGHAGVFTLADGAAAAVSRRAFAGMLANVLTAVVQPIGWNDGVGDRVWPGRCWFGWVRLCWCFRSFLRKMMLSLVVRAAPEDGGVEQSRL